jgi:hypothetical protein
MESPDPREDESDGWTAPQTPASPGRVRNRSRQEGYPTT